MEIADRSAIFIDTNDPFQRMEIFRKDICVQMTVFIRDCGECYMLFRKLEIVRVINETFNFGILFLSFFRRDDKSSFVAFKSYDIFISKGLIKICSKFFLFCNLIFHIFTRIIIAITFFILLSSYSSSI